MTQSNVMKKFNELPPEAQRQVLDFITFLETRYPAAGRNASRKKFSEEKFIGIWKGRSDLQNSVAWVRKNRAAEWRSVK